LARRRAILIYGYDYPDWAMDPAIEAFDLLADQLVQLSPREESPGAGLIHFVHQEGRVFAWRILEGAISRAAVPDGFQPRASTASRTKVN